MNCADLTGGDYAIVTHSVASMRKASSNQSEQVSQQICGQVCKINGHGDGWVNVESSDHYCGWVRSEHLSHWGAGPEVWPLGELRCDVFITCSPLAPLFSTHQQTSATLLPLGSRIVVHETERDMPAGMCSVSTPLGMRDFAMPTEGYMYLHDLLRPASNGAAYEYTPKALCRLACCLQGVPYLWGGVTPFGYDCSGYVQSVFSLFGISLPRDAYQQADCAAGTPLPPGTTPLAGDLVFFRGISNPHNRKVSHVGICLGDDEMVHASGLNGVAISTMSSEDITSAYEVTGYLRIDAP